MNVTVIQTVWRRIRRPSGETMRKLRRQESGAIVSPTITQWVEPCTSGAPNHNRPVGMSKREATKFAKQNIALLYVLESHSRGHSNLSAGALHAVKSALAPV